jgi:hypothetical protein
VECVEVFGWAHCDFSSRLQCERRLMVGTLRLFLFVVLGL